MRIVCIGYREWALNIYSRIQRFTNHEVVIIKAQSDFDFSSLEMLKPDFVLFYGWSWRIPLGFISTHKCLMLHPSDLPKYRGGSPIQNQILNGILDSKISIFQCTDEIDAGPILAQRPLSLRGELSEILDRVEHGGLEATLDILKGDYRILKQAKEDASYYQRRSPSQSEITLNELKTSSAVDIYNKVRSLQDPYPNAFIKMYDGSKLFLKSVSIDVE